MVSPYLVVRSCQYREIKMENIDYILQHAFSSIFKDVASNNIPAASLNPSFFKMVFLH